MGEYFTRSFTVNSARPVTLPPGTSYTVLSASVDEEAVSISRSDNLADFAPLPFRVAVYFKDEVARRLASSVTQTVVLMMTTGEASFVDMREDRIQTSRNFNSVSGVATTTTDLLIVPAANNPRGINIKSAAYNWTNPTVGNVIQVDMGTNIFEHVCNGIYESSAAGGPGATVIRQALFDEPVLYPANADLYLKIQIPVAGAFRFCYNISYKPL